jgi:hypothetical protein
MDGCNSSRLQVRGDAKLQHSQRFEGMATVEMSYKGRKGGREALGEDGEKILLPAALSL